MSIEEKKIRLEWLDIAKGITIILMVMGHSAIPNELARFIFAFHMPLFFIASGITTKYPSFLAFFKKKSKGLLFPFIIYSIIVLALKAVLIHNSIYEEFTNWLKYGWLGMALWFVPVLYLSLIVCWCINIISNKWIKSGVIVILPIISFFLCYNKIWLPWNIATVPFAAFFIVLGSFMNQYFLYIDKLCQKWYVYVILFVITILISHYWRLDMAWNKCTPIILLTCGAVSGTTLFFCFSKLIEKSSSMITAVLTAIGKETFAILAFSQITILYINKYLIVPFYAKYGMLCIVLLLIVLFKNKFLKKLKINI